MKYKTERPYPENLLFAILDEDIETVKDKIDGLEYVLKTLTEREQYIIRERFVNDEPLELIAKHFNVVRERIRQIEVKALRKLRHPSRKQYFEKGLIVVEAVNKLREELHEQELLTMLDDVRKKHKDSYENKIAHIQNTEYNIAKCGFSCRLYNSLNRAGYKTIIDVINQPLYKIKQLEAMGPKSFSELESYIQSLGLEWEE